MKHLIETENPSGLATVPYDRIVLDSTENDVIVKGGGYEYVDLGLPNGLKWAKCNVGAESETDYGYYFQWGSTTPNTNTICDWANYKYCNGNEWTLTKYNTSTDYGKNPDDKTTLDSEDDAARANMGGDWRMPTETELRELIDNTAKEWTTINEVNGYKFTASNGNYIFIPAAGGRLGSEFSDQGSNGSIWSSSLDYEGHKYASELYFNSGNCGVYGTARFHGLSVRGVRE